MLALVGCSAVKPEMLLPPLVGAAYPDALQPTSFTTAQLFGGRWCRSAFLYSFSLSKRGVGSVITGVRLCLRFKGISQFTSALGKPKWGVAGYCGKFTVKAQHSA